MLIVRPCRSTLSLDSEALEGRLSTGYPIETYIQKNSGHKHIRRRRTQIGLKLQSRRKKLILTTKPPLFIRMDIVCANGLFYMLGCSRFRYTIFQFRFIRFEKATSYLSIGFIYLGRSPELEPGGNHGSRT